MRHKDIELYEKPFRSRHFSFSKKRRTNEKEEEQQPSSSDLVFLIVRKRRADEVGEELTLPIALSVIVYKDIAPFFVTTNFLVEPRR